MSHRLRLALVVLLAVLVHAPSLGWGFFCDDHGILLVIEGEVDSPTMRPWSLYDFGDLPEPGSEHFELGSFAWWTGPDWDVRFFRPAASLALMADHALFGRWAPGWHLSSLAWFAAYLALAHALFRALGLGPRTALLATAVLGFDDGGAFPIGWIANRNSLVEAVFVVAALLAVARPARVRAGHVALALALALVATLAKESGLAAFPLVAVVLAWRARSAKWSGERADAVSPGLARNAAAVALVTALVYVAWYVATGHGARCAFYPTPWGQPAAFVRGAALLVASAPFALTTPLAPEPLGMDQALAATVFPYAAVLALALIGAALILARRVPRLLPFVAIALLTLAPQAGAPTSQRLYFLPMLGVAPLLAILITSWWSAGGARRFTARALAVTTVFVSGISCLGMSTWFGTVTRDVREIIVDADVGPDAEGTREALVLNSPTEFAQLVPITTWVVETGDRTLRWWPLQLGKRALRWTRTGDATFELAIAADTAPPFGEGPVERVLIASDRVDDATLAARRWRTALFDVEPVRVDDGVRTARFTLSRSLDDPSIRFLAWDGERLARIAPPAIGATIELAAVPPLMPMMP